MRARLASSVATSLISNLVSSPSFIPGGATLAMLSYVLVNFCYNVLLLLITKHGSAMLLVISTALALPITNTAFSLPLIMWDVALSGANR